MFFTIPIFQKFWFLQKCLYKHVALKKIPRVLRHFQIYKMYSNTFDNTFISWKIGKDRS